MTGEYADRISANALALMAVGLVVLYHAGPWPWMSRTLTLAGSALPLALLSAVLPSAAATACSMVVVLGLGTLAANLLGSPRTAFASYAIANVAGQALLTVIWWLWWFRGSSWIALLGAILATIGAGMAAYLHVLVGDPNPPDPLLRWTDAGTPVDMISFARPALLALEEPMLWLAVIVWLWAVALPWARARFL